MRQYESVVVFTPTLSESQLKEEIKKVEVILAQHKATDLATDNWGRREIAYSVGKHRHGHFVSFNYKTSEHGITSGLASILRITDNVLKFQTHRIGEPVRKFKGNPKRIGSSALDSGIDDFVDVDY